MKGAEAEEHRRVHSAPPHKRVVPPTQADPSMDLPHYLEQPGGGKGGEP